MSKKAISTKEAPAAIGPYNQAVEVNGLVYTSGVLPMDKITGEICGGDVKSQTKLILENLQAVLKAENLTLDAVVKTTVFMTDLSSFADMNEVYAEFFKGFHPARSTIQVVALPKGALLEIEAIASTK
ncbi:MAG: RidA family protein [Elusimicrobiaceae bacterium]|mgnify:CR=1|nr:RidA family protein [Elusimicrobiaceae bacterium]MBT3954564.1 RidA family protein [Elusimicrobiaceae bacterium]MBT4007872.1 RidA family protein [Elusimicrobiaceae bacterium]MBT4402558.1 RidA family protein [Elusimicrobiaceae bacterium]MBT4439886.1 RidA family protein [Elusimicrobiaceae bacterium]